MSRGGNLFICSGANGPSSGSETSAKRGRELAAEVHVALPTFPSKYRQMYSSRASKILDKEKWKKGSV